MSFWKGTALVATESDQTPAERLNNLSMVTKFTSVKNGSFHVYVLSLALSLHSKVAVFRMCQTILLECQNKPPTPTPRIHQRVCSFLLPMLLLRLIGISGKAKSTATESLLPGNGPKPFHVLGWFRWQTWAPRLPWSCEEFPDSLASWFTLCCVGILSSLKRHGSHSPRMRAKSGRTWECLKEVFPLNLFIHLFSKYLLNIYHVTGTTLGAGHIRRQEPYKDKNPCGNRVSIVVNILELRQ